MSTNTNTNAKTLSLTDILTADRRTIVPVDVPEWGGKVHVRDMTADERDRFELSNFDSKDEFVATGYRARAVAACMCGEDGKLLAGPEHVKKLGELSSPALTRVFEAAAKLNKLRKVDQDAEKKDSPAAP